MNKLLHAILSTPLIAHFPVRVRSGIAQGARWTFYPWTSYWRGTHEPAVQNRLLQLKLNWEGMHVWDLGSHYGIYAIGLGRRVGPQGSVAAFEPNTLSYSRLCRHIQMNGLSHVKAFPFAVSSNAGKEKLFLYHGLNTTTSHLAYEGETWNESIPTVTIKTERLDDMAARGEIHPPDFIKVDVEGHGHHALAGAAKTLAAHRPILMIGLHSVPEMEGILKILTPLDYRITPISPGAPVQPTPEFDYLFEPNSRSESSRSSV